MDYLLVAKINCPEEIQLVQASFLQSGNILHELKKKLRSSRGAKIAVAFLSKDGFEELEADLRHSLNKGNRIQLIVGISGYHITDWQALTHLLDMDDTFGNMEVGYFYSEGFHPKIFFFEDGEKRTAIVGSSNLTFSGLTKNVEANVLLEGSRSDEVFKDIEVFYGNLWEASPYLDEDIVRRYKDSQIRHRSRASRTRPKIPKTKLPRTADLSSVDVVRNSNRGIAFWKVAPGRHAGEWSWWEDHVSPSSKGFVAIGWSLIGDLRELMSEPENGFKAEIRRRVLEAEYDSDPDYAAKQFWLFCRLVREGDIVVAYSRRHIFGIAEVKSPYYFDERDASEGHFAHKRDVDWKVFPKLVPPKGIMSVLATNDTVHPLTNLILIRYIKEFS